MSAVLAHCATIPEPDALEEEFSLVAALIDARTRAGLTQEQAASPPPRTLELYAVATGSRLRIIFEP